MENRTEKEETEVRVGRRMGRADKWSQKGKENESEMEARWMVAIKCSRNCFRFSQLQQESTWQHNSINDNSSDDNRSNDNSNNDNSYDSNTNNTISLSLKQNEK